MTRDKVKLMRDRLNAALVEFGKEFGVNVEVGRATYGETNATFKIEFAEVAADGVVQNRAAADFKLMASSFGLPEDALGREFKFRGQAFKVVGLNTRRPKFPVEVERADGKRFKMTEQMVADGLGVKIGGLKDHKAYLERLVVGEGGF